MRRKIKLLSLAVLMGSLSFGLTCPVHSQDPAAEDPDAPISKEKLMTLAKRIQQQQVQIEANQIKINSLIAETQEAVRQAWVYSRRASK